MAIPIWSSNLIACSWYDLHQDINRLITASKMNAVFFWWSTEYKPWYKLYVYYYEIDFVTMSGCHLKIDMRSISLDNSKRMRFICDICRTNQNTYKLAKLLLLQSMHVEFTFSLERIHLFFPVATVPTRHILSNIF